MNDKNMSAPDLRLGGLRRFAVSITLFNIAGHFFLGFEQSWAQPLAALATAYSLEILLEWIEARSAGRTARFRQGAVEMVNFLLPAHIAALSVAMLIYTNDRLFPTVFATAAAIGSKALFRAAVNGGKRHFFNPSNFGISLALILFPWVGIAPPYHFTEELGFYGDWTLPFLIIVSGSFLNARFAHRLPLVAAWWTVFILQALLRGFFLDGALPAALMPISGVAFILYSFYMITDPATSPVSTRAQVLFGTATALCYGLLVTMHIVFGLFFALTIAGALWGAALYLQGVLPQILTSKAVPKWTFLFERSEP